MSTEIRRIAVGRRGKAAAPSRATPRTVQAPGPSGASQIVLEDIYLRPDLIDREVFPNRQSAHIRSPWILSTKWWLRQGIYISLYVNPLEASWSMPRRETMVKTKAGTVRNVWRNRYRKSSYDEFTINFTFQAGNIMPGQPYGEFEDKDTRLANPSVPNGLNNFYSFLEMIDQPALLGTEENRHIIYYRSRTFPRLYMEGFFAPEPITFSDSATNGNTIQWSHSFIVYKTSPKINKSSDMARVYQSWVREYAAMEVVPLVLQEAEVRRGLGTYETLRTATNTPTKPGATAGGIYSDSIGLPDLG